MGASNPSIGLTAPIRRKLRRKRLCSAATDAVRLLDGLASGAGGAVSRGPSGAPEVQGFSPVGHGWHDAHAAQVGQAQRTLWDSEKRAEKESRPSSPHGDADLARRACPPRL